MKGDRSGKRECFVTETMVLHKEDYFWMVTLEKFVCEWEINCDTPNSKTAHTQFGSVPRLLYGQNPWF